MPLFLDVHRLDGAVTMDDVATAHLADLQTQGKYDVRYLRYWVDEGAGQIHADSARLRRDPSHTGGGGFRSIAHRVTVRPARFVSTPRPYSGTHPALAHRASQSSTGPASGVQSTSLRVGGCDIRERYSLPKTA